MPRSRYPKAPFQLPEPGGRQPPLAGRPQDQRRVLLRRSDLFGLLVDHLVGESGERLAVQLDPHLAPAVGEASALLAVEQGHVRQLIHDAPHLAALALDDVGGAAAPADRAAPQLEPESREPRRPDEPRLGREGGHLLGRHVAAVREEQHAQPSAAPIRTTAWSISSSLTVSGGSNRTVSGPVAWATSRCSSRRRRASAGPSEVAKASISPRPRTSRPRARRAPDSASPFRRTSARKSSSSTTSSTALAAAAATGPPAKVEPWSPVWRSVACSDVVTQAPIGSPPPSPLATVMTSGTMPESSHAQRSPLRPMPHWISSKTNSAPLSSQASRAAASICGWIGWIPDSPWIGSMITAAVRSVTAWTSGSGGPSRGTAVKPGTSGAKGACFDSCGVAESAPIVRP